VPGYLGIFSESIPKVKTITLIIFGKKSGKYRKKRLRGAHKSRILSLSIVTYPQGITVFIYKKISVFDKVCIKKHFYTNQTE